MRNGNSFAFAAMLLVGGLLVPAGVQAAGCEQIKDTFAYNECLARQAPPRAQRIRSGRGGDPEGNRVQRRADPDAGLAARGVTINRRSGRRVTATIDPWAGARSAAPRRKRR